MKKTTYMIIGLLLMMFLTMVIGFPLLFDRAIGRYANTEIETVDSIKGYTGITTVTDIAGCNILELDNPVVSGPLFVDVVFDPQSDSSAIVMDNLWYDEAEIDNESHDGLYTVTNTLKLFEQSDEDKGSTKDGKRVIRRITCTIDSGANLFATVILPASPHIRTVIADGFSVRVYGNVPQGFNIKSSDLQFCGEYNNSKPENK